MTDETLESTNSDAQIDDGQQEQNNPIQNGVKKLLSQRNSYKVENEQLKAELDAMKQELNQSITQQFSERERTQEKLSFTQTYWDDNLAIVEEVIAKYPTISYADALKIAKPEEFVARWQTISMQGNIPNRVTVDKTTKEMNTDELKQIAQKELEAMGIRSFYPL